MSNERRPLRVLLAESSIGGRKLTVALLEEWGHEVVVASNRVEALQALQASEVDLALMEVQTPEMDGFEATRTIREQERGSGRRLPIVGLTAGATKDDRDRCLEAGMDGYVAKPIHARELLAAIDAALPPKQDTADREAGTREEQVDWKAALDFVNGSRELLEELVEIFVAEYPRLLVDIHKAIENQDNHGLLVAAHRLKGSLRYFGESRAAELALDLENLGREGNIAEAKYAEAKYSDLEEALRRLLPALRSFR